ncbi:Glycosyltransferase involved in cell wall bisynthesis [Micromonospora coriariae]|uniref:Glycosyltransferase involved in cell wall bisynthesis n=1 Tax=Micromonospora coriariae TaxID=285665 RepID=A0A1C4Y107_9ACTN|nr:glycosyltransferase [Micromonospora coriariae]SCF14081.1 Glycosyltransferase involved in cell wall bisynthesis [Micromonospora coriariae]
MSLTVLMNAGPWLSVPPPGYGGIENVIATLVPELRRLGVRVVLASVESSTLPVDEKVSVFSEGQFASLQRPYNQVCGIAQAHLAGVVRELRARDDIDLVHDHVEAVGLATLAAMGPTGPPTLHTLHWDLAKHPALYGSLDGGGRVRVNGVSASQLDRAPRALREHSVGHVHLSTPLAVDADRRSRPEKGEHLLILGRINPGKGQDVGARLAHQVGFPLVLAGPVGPYHRPAELAAAGDEARQNPDVRFFLDEVAPHVDGDLVRWVGTVAGQERDDLLASARASLFPLRWEEPGGTAVVESLALGTPVVATTRGCLPELIEHGRTGLLTANEEELGELVLAAELLDVDECRRVAAQRFTPAVMAQRYVELYQRVRQLASVPRLQPV